MYRKLLLFCCFFISLISFAQTFTVNGLRYEVIGTNKVSLLPKSESNSNDKYKGSINIPEAIVFNDIPFIVVQIGRNAFSNCMAITSIKMPNTIQYIEQNAFFNTPITKLTLSENLLEIAPYAFEQCHIQTLTLPESLESIGTCAFRGCVNLKTISIPSGVDILASSTFSSCTSLESVHIGASVSTIEASVFSSCQKLCSITVSDANTHYCTVDDVLYSKDMTELVVVPMGKFTSFEVPEGVEKLLSGAFSGSKKVTSIVIPETVKSIGSSCFTNCTNLIDITLPSNLLMLDSYCFSGCASLVDITLPSELVIIRSNSFSGCSNLTSITLPSKLLYLDKQCFSDCTNLTNIIFPDSLISIFDYAFSGCTSLLKIQLPVGIESIGNYCFKNCGNLTEVSIKGSPEIGFKAFEDCPLIDKISCYSLKPPTALYAFSTNNYRWATLYVPLAAIDNYQTATGWKEFKNIIGANYDPIAQEIFNVIVNDSSIANGATVVCTDFEDNTDFDGDNFGYDYNINFALENLTSKNQTITGTLIWGAYPTKEEYFLHKDDPIMDAGEQVWYSYWGIPQLCSLSGNCYSSGTDNLGEGPIILTEDRTENGFSVHLRDCPPNLTSEYKLLLMPDSDTYSIFECRIVFAPSQEAADAFLQGSSVPNVQEDNNDKEYPVRYYNLQGQEISSPTHGLYIKRQGTTSSKILLP